MSHNHERARAAPSVSRLDNSFEGCTLYDWVRPLVVGLVHGLAGSAAVALLVLTTLHEEKWALAYLLIFGAGTIAGMMLITVGMASVIRHAGDHSDWINRYLSVATGGLSLAFGLFILYQIGFVHGLFRAHPTWIAR